MRRIDGVLCPTPGELALYRFYSRLRLARIAAWCHTCDTTFITDVPPDVLWVQALARDHRSHRLETVTEEMEDLVNPGWRRGFPTKRG